MISVWKHLWHCKHIVLTKQKCFLGSAGVLMETMVQGLQCPLVPLLPTCQGCSEGVEFSASTCQRCRQCGWLVGLYV